MNNPIPKAIFILLILSVYSCTDNKNPYEYVDEPNNLEELHKGFFINELTPDTFKHHDSSIIVVSTGHTYPLLNDKLAFNAFVSTIQNQNPDLVFILGDMVYDNTQDEWNSFFNYFKGLKDKMYFAPGNHDLNFHYERYNGIRDNQFIAEKRYVENIGYRYKVLKSKFANFVFINMNDSLDRIVTYLDAANGIMDKGKTNFFFSSQSAWHSSSQDPNNVQTWPLKSFTRKELFPSIEHFDYMIHGDWNKKFYRGYWTKKNGEFHVMAVGNKRKGDSLFITRMEIKKDTVITTPIAVEVPENSNWYK